MRIISKFIQHFFNHFLKNKYLKVSRNYSKINFLLNINQRPQRQFEKSFNNEINKKNNFYFSIGSGYGNILEAILPVFSLKKLSDINVNFIIEDKFYKIKSLIKFLYQDFNDSEFIKSNELEKINDPDAVIIILPYTYFKINIENIKKIDLSNYEFHYDSLYHKEYYSHGLLLEKLFKEKINLDIQQNFFSYHNIVKKNNKKKIIGICSGKRSGEYSNREYPYFKELVELLNKNFEVRSFGKKDEYIEGTLDYTNNEFDFIKIFKSMRMCDLIIGSDCGMMHFAERACAKTLWIFGPTVSNKVGPIHGETIRKYYPCGPCTHTVNYFKCKTNDCMKSIDYNYLFLKINSCLELNKKNELNRFDKKEFLSKFILDYQLEDNSLIDKQIRKKNKFPINLLKFSSMNENFQEIKYEEGFVEKVSQNELILPLILNENNLDIINQFIIKRPLINYQKIIIFSFYDIEFGKLSILKKFFLYFDDIGYLRLNLKSFKDINHINLIKNNLYHSYKILGYTLKSVRIYKKNVCMFFRDIKNLKDDTYSSSNVFYLESDEDLLNFEIYCQKYFYKKIKLFPYSKFLPVSRNYEYVYNLGLYKLLKPFKYE